MREEEGNKQIRELKYVESLSKWVKGKGGAGGQESEGLLLPVRCQRKPLQGGDTGGQRASQGKNIPGIVTANTNGTARRPLQPELNEGRRDGQKSSEVQQTFASM